MQSGRGTVTKPEPPEPDTMQVEAETGHRVLKRERWLDPCCERRAARTPVQGTVTISLHPFRSEVAWAPAELDLKLCDWVVFQDDNGDELGRIIGRTESETTEIEIVRRATEGDLHQAELNRAKADQALKTFRQLVNQFRLPMKAVDAHLRFDRREICFYFVSDERLNFRALHKAVSSALSVRVAIRQVGVRDYSRVIGGIGLCGRVLCCAGFLTELKPITLRMARQQSLFVEPAKISGICGKLLCCLSFEESVYRDALDQFPKIGTAVRTQQGKGRVTSIDIFNRRVTIAFDAGEMIVPLEEVKRE
jgi:cell fate regulator YaaT (PSP1 superfamily)